MPSRVPLVSTAFGTLFSWAAFYFVVTRIDPGSGIVAFILFYMVLALSLMGTFFIVGVMVRRVAARTAAPTPEALSLVIRQSLLLTILLIVLTVLQGARLLTGYVTLLLAGALVLFELYFLTRPSPTNRESSSQELPTASEPIPPPSRVTDIMPPPVRS
ncbi:MAG: hypothetical protein HY459_04885 [Parcubacteria group bacterium]|nr:hypothetical protein [Parcubacteria group bacterium]